MEHIFATNTASITELKTNPMHVIAEAGGEPIAILNRNKPAFYCIAPAVYEKMLEAMDDAHLVALVKKRTSAREIPVSLNDL